MDKHKEENVYNLSTVFCLSGKNVKCMQAVFKMHIMFLIDLNCWSKSDLSVKYAFIHFKKCIILTISDVMAPLESLRFTVYLFI